MKKKILIGVGALLLLGINAALSVVGMNMFGKAPPAMVAEPVPVAALPEEIYYYNVQPEFVVNFQRKSKVKFLMIELAVAVNDEEVNAVLDDHDPELRNSLLMFFSEQNSEELKSAEGKEALRQGAITVVEDIVSKHYKSGRVKDVYVTRLVMQ